MVHCNRSPEKPQLCSQIFPPGFKRSSDPPTTTMLPGFINLSLIIDSNIIKIKLTKQKSCHDNSIGQPDITPPIVISYREIHRRQRDSQIYD
jgi:hypothetical protein